MRSTTTRYVIAGDGCLMEGVSHEAASLAGHLGLGKLIAIYDDNHITIDGDTALAYSDDVAGRFRAYGWHVIELGEIANDLDALEAALDDAKAVTDRPSLLVLRSHIGYPSPDHTDDHEAHGLAFDAGDVTRTKAVMGIPDEPFWAPAEVVDTLPRLTPPTAAPQARPAWADATPPTWSRRPSGSRAGIAPVSTGGPTISRPTSWAIRSPPARRSRPRSRPPSKRSPVWSRVPPT